MSATNWRGLCEELADKLAACWPSTFDAPDCLSRARAALAQPEPEVRELSDQELDDLADATPWHGSPRRFGREVARAAIAADRARWGRPAPASAGEVGEGVTDEELLETLDKATAGFPPRHPEAEALNAVEYSLALELRKARAVLARYGHQPAPPAEVAPGSAIEDVGPLIAWLTEQAHQAADASQPTDAGMLTWAAQVIGERVDEDAPAPPAAGEVGELVRWLRGANWDSKRQTLATRAADLLERQAAPVPALPEDAQVIEPSEHTILVLVPVPVSVSERPWEREGWCDEQGRCWFGWHRPMHNLNPAMWMLCPPDVRDFLFHNVCLPAPALPLPSGEVEP